MMTIHSCESGSIVFERYKIVKGLHEPEHLRNVSFRSNSNPKEYLGVVENDNGGNSKLQSTFASSSDVIDGKIFTFQIIEEGGYIPVSRSLLS